MGVSQHASHHKGLQVRCSLGKLTSLVRSDDFSSVIDLGSTVHNWKCPQSAPPCQSLVTSQLHR